MAITDIVALDIEHPTRRNVALLPSQQVLRALQYYATSTFQYVAEKISDYVKFPDARNTVKVKDVLYTNHTMS